MRFFLTFTVLALVLAFFQVNANDSELEHARVTRQLGGSYQSGGGRPGGSGGIGPRPGGSGGIGIGLRPGGSGGIGIGLRPGGSGGIGVGIGPIGGGLRPSAGYGQGTLG